MMNAFGWSHFKTVPPRGDLLVQFHNGGFIWLGRGQEIGPEVDAAWLWWRRTGIAKQEEAL